jgi:hypothetical protein
MSVVLSVRVRKELKEKAELLGISIRQQLWDFNVT